MVTTATIDYYLPVPSSKSQRRRYKISNLNYRSWSCAPAKPARRRANQKKIALTSFAFVHIFPRRDKSSASIYFKYFKYCMLTYYIVYFTVILVMFMALLNLICNKSWIFVEDFMNGQQRTATLDDGISSYWKSVGYEKVVFVIIIWKAYFTTSYACMAFVLCKFRFVDFSIISFRTEGCIHISGYQFRQDCYKFLHHNFHDGKNHLPYYI